MIITSLENNKIKELVKLQKKKYRDLTNTFIVEGDHLVNEVIKEGFALELFVLDGEHFSYNLQTTYVSEDVMKKISTMDSIPKIIALCNKINSKKIIGNRILLLDEIQDPGNLGTIIRSAVAFNITTIILSNNTVDLYNPKVLRSTQGMFAHINIINMDENIALKELKEANYIIYGTSVNNGVDVRKLTNEEKNKFCLIMGNEGSGMNNNISKQCDKNLYIKMNSNVESLNVGIACSILLYELDR